MNKNIYTITLRKKDNSLVEIKIQGNHFNIQENIILIDGEDFIKINQNLQFVGVSRDKID